MTKSRKGYRKLKNFNKIATTLKKPKLKIEQVAEEQREKFIDEAGEAYKFVQRREITVKKAEDLPALSGVYSAQLLNMSKKADPEPDAFEDMNKPNGILKLPDDGSIFHDNIPFHHFSLTTLQPKHIRRLKKNGIEVKQAAFSYLEDGQIRENWHNFAAAHEIPETEAPRYMSAATATESPEEHKERIQFIRATFFRPWMCSRLLDRTAAQVFRRCYHLYHVSNLESEATRPWTDEEDSQLLELVKLNGRKWELIGNELLRPRYYCARRYIQLTGSQEEPEQAEAGTSSSENARGQEWDRVEIARLYEYLCDHLPHNPVLVALVRRYHNLDTNINWTDEKMKLPGRSAIERKARWEQLKKEFQNVKEQLQSDRPKEILRELIPEDTKILAKARIGEAAFNRKKLKASDHAKWMDSVREYCEEHSIEQIKDIDAKQLEKKLKSEELLKSPFRHMWRQFRFMLFTVLCIGLLKMLPLDEDKLTVHLKLLVFILRNIDKLRVKKRTLRKYTRRFIRIQGWQQREPIILVDQKRKKPGAKTVAKMIAAERQRTVDFAAI